MGSSTASASVRRNVTQEWWRSRTCRSMELTRSAVGSDRPPRGEPSQIPRVRRMHGRGSQGVPEIWQQNCRSAPFDAVSSPARHLAPTAEHAHRNHAWAAVALWFGRPDRVHSRRCAPLRRAANGAPEHRPGVRPELIRDRRLRSTRSSHRDRSRRARPDRGADIEG